jgi:hypothetical protein
VVLRVVLLLLMLMNGGRVGPQAINLGAGPVELTPQALILVRGGPEVVRKFRVCLDEPLVLVDGC